MRVRERMIFAIQSPSPDSLHFAASLLFVLVIESAFDKWVEREEEKERESSVVLDRREKQEPRGESEESAGKLPASLLLRLPTDARLGSGLGSW